MLLLDTFHLPYVESNFTCFVAIVTTTPRRMSVELDQNNADYSYLATQASRNSALVAVIDLAAATGRNSHFMVAVINLGFCYLVCPQLASSKPALLVDNLVNDALINMKPLHAAEIPQ